MTSQEKANWIRRIFTLCLFGAAAAAGLFFAMPQGGPKGGERKRSGLQLNQENIAQVQASPDKLTVTNMTLDGNPDSAKLQAILEKLKKDKYRERVMMAELNVNDQPALAASQGVKEEGFKGHLDFHANGRRLEQLVGQTDPVVVEKTIDRLLEGLVQRIGKDWLPDVPGMQRGHGQEVLPIQPVKPAKSPGKP